MNPLTIKRDGLVEKYRGAHGNDEKRGNVGTETTAAPSGDPSVHISRTYIVKLQQGWREIFLDHEFRNGSLFDSVRNGQTYTVVMRTDTGRTQRVPARISTREFCAVFFPDAVEDWNQGEAERFWQEMTSATFWLEYQTNKDDQGHRVSAVIQISQPDL